MRIHCRCKHFSASLTFTQLPRMYFRDLNFYSVSFWAMFCVFILNSLCEECIIYYFLGKIPKLTADRLRSMEQDRSFGLFFNIFYVVRPILNSNLTLSPTLVMVAKIFKNVRLDVLSAEWPFFFHRARATLVCARSHVSKSHVTVSTLK